MRPAATVCLAGLYLDRRLQGSECSLDDSDFTRALCILEVQAPEAAQATRGKKQAAVEQESEAAGSEPGSKRPALPGWSRADLPPRLLNLQLLLRLLALVGKLQVDTLYMGSGCHADHSGDHA